MNKANKCLIPQDASIEYIAQDDNGDVRVILKQRAIFVGEYKRVNYEWKAFQKCKFKNGRLIRIHEFADLKPLEEKFSNIHYVLKDTCFIGECLHL